MPQTPISPIFGSSGIPPFKIALYQDKLATTPIELSVTWDKFCEFITDYIEESPCTVADGPNKCKGKECPHKSFSSIKNNPMAWSPVEIIGKRLDENVRFVTLLSLDFDHITAEEQAKLTSTLSAYDNVWHTTHNDRPTDSCVRYILLLSRPVPANQWATFLRAAIDFLGITIMKVVKGKAQYQPDRTCKNRSRFYYRPSHPMDAPYGKGRQHGKVLNVDEVFAYAANNPTGASVAVEDDEPSVKPLPSASKWDLDSEAVTDAIESVSLLFPDNQRNELAMALAGMLRRAGATQDDARYIVREICAQGGSTDPDARARVVDHTYDLVDDAAMTGFTRVAEILGDDVAKTFGDYLTDASNDVALKGLKPREVPAVYPVLASYPALSSVPALPAGIPPLPAGVPALPTLPVYVAPAAQVHTDINALRKQVSELAGKKSRSMERDDKINGILLRRVIHGEPLARAGGIGDVETVREGEDYGVKPDDAMRLVVGSLAYTFPLNTPWGAAAEILRASIASLPATPGVNWMEAARKAYRRAQTKRILDEDKQAQEKVAYTEAVRANALVHAGALVQPQPALLSASSTAMVPYVPNADGNGPPRNPPPPPAAPPPPPGPPDGAEWRKLLTTAPNGAPAQTYHNARVILDNHEDFLGHIRWNEVSKRVEIHGGPLMRHSKMGIEGIVAGAEDYLTSTHGVGVQYAGLARRIISTARANAYDPIKDYLNSLVWDGVPRKNNWLKTYCGASKESDEYLEKVGSRWLVALVARGLEPGCKVDNVLVLESPPGTGKSTIFEIIGGEWFCDTAISLGDKDSRMMAGHYWLCEMAEIVAFKKTGHDVLKSFFSSRVDKFRPPYGASFEDFPRRCVFVGTTNDDSYLGDETGNRKYWPVAAAYTAGATAALRRDRDQLLAEAVVAYRAGEPWHFGYNEISVTEEEADKRMIEAPTSTKVISWWYGMTKSERPAVVTTMEVAEMALEALPMQVKHGDLTAIGHALKKMGFLKNRDSLRSGRCWRYYATEELLNAERTGMKKQGLFQVIPGGKKDDEDKK